MIVWDAAGAFAGATEGSGVPKLERQVSVLRRVLAMTEGRKRGRGYQRLHASSASWC